jgi:hypothetical protein
MAAFLRMICRFLRIDIQAPPSLPISLIRNADETIALLALMARFVGRTHGAHHDQTRPKRRL